MSDLIESARKAIERYDAAAPAGVRSHACALECVGLLRSIVEHETAKKEAMESAHRAAMTEALEAVFAYEAKEQRRKERWWAWMRPWSRK